jgi:hypothetical protein
MIWQVSGAVGRVKQFVVAAQQGSPVPHVGVTGLPKDRVMVLPNTDCFKYFSNDQEAVAAKSAAAALLGGKVPDLMVGKYTLSRIRLPVGTSSDTHPYENALAVPKTAAALAVHQELLRYNKGGVAINDPKAVVSAAPAKVYDVLPQAAGLLQLIEKGVLEVSVYSRAYEFDGMRVIGFEGRRVVGGEKPIEVSKVPTAFRILGPMQFPAGLDVGHSVEFSIAPGIAMPKNSPGASSVTCEVTGKPIKPGEICK